MFIHESRNALVVPGEGVTPDLVKRVRGTLHPEVGLTWDTSNRTGDPPVNPELSHSIKTVSSLKVRKLQVANGPLK